MIDNFAFAANAVLPMLLLMLLGYYLKKRGIFEQKTIQGLNIFAFRFGISALMFRNVYTIDSIRAIPLDLMIFILVSCVAITLMSAAAALSVTKQRGRRGVLIQVGFRSNYAVIGAALATALGGAEGEAVSASMQAPGIIYFNVMAVICLSLFSEAEDNSIDILSILKSMITNPLIQALSAGLFCLIIREWIPRNPDGTLVFSLSGSLPIIYSFISSLANMATPLLLILLGSQIDFKAAGSIRKEITVGVILRLIAAPALGFLMAFWAASHHMLSLSPAIISTLIAFYGAPNAGVSAVMAEQMGCDGELARQCVVWTTVFCMITLFLWIVGFRTVGLL